MLYFPRSRRELWANSETLEDGSPYWATLLASGFSEATAEARQSIADDDASDFSEEENEDDSEEDSDLETDEIPIKAITIRQSSSIPAGVREIVITEAAFTTYRAILSHIYSGHIKFANLTPPIAASVSDDQVLAACEAKAQAAAKRTGLPLAASPKSVYKLAHLLEMPELEAVALADFRGQLTTHNVLHQLTTGIPLARVYILQ